MAQKKYEIGMVGLGVMGRNMLLNIAEHGFSAAGYDKDPKRVAQLHDEAKDLPVKGADNVADFVVLLKKPRAIMMLVPAGPIVDSVIHDLLPHLEPGDLIIDAGNSHFTDTDLRQKTLEEKGLHFFGMGVSGGEYGARHGPSMMPGGPKQAYGVVRSVLEACAAQVDGDPCVTYLGPGSAGHYVKMVHNGIEYGIMQLISETYDILRKGLDLNNDELGDLFSQWNQAELNGYLIEITAEIFRKVDDGTGKRLIDIVLDAARQKGTGMWTSQDALALHEPTPNIDISVAMRNLSGLDGERAAVTGKFGSAPQPFKGEREVLIEQTRRSLYAAIIVTYAQGMAQLRAASRTYQYNLNLSDVARIWRGGCIIRSALLEPIRVAYAHQPDLLNILLDDTLGKAFAERVDDLRAIAQVAIQSSIPVPAFTATLAYYDSLRAKRLPANLIQAQRDYFGAHTYERVDERGIFHTEWGSEQE
ncbi:MAG TPA: NADP-dependent phosphogluconate dehydrogenase [Anaerolineales bacterium]|nr:NADP-dependent phosphogluconate dehydrogenase [Anaerolineales bacterium]